VIKFKEGDKSFSNCPSCGRAPITMEYRTVPLMGGEKEVKNLLVGICDICNRVITVPRQERPKIVDEIEKVEGGKDGHTDCDSTGGIGG